MDALNLLSYAMPRELLIRSGHVPPGGGANSQALNNEAAQLSECERWPWNPPI